MLRLMKLAKEKNNCLPMHCFVRATQKEDKKAFYSSTLVQFWRGPGSALLRKQGGHSSIKRKKVVLPMFLSLSFSMISCVNCNLRQE